MKSFYTFYTFFAYRGLLPLEPRLSIVHDQVAILVRMAPTAFFDTLLAANSLHVKVLEHLVSNIVTNLSFFGLDEPSVPVFEQLIRLMEIVLADGELFLFRGDECYLAQLVE